MAVRNSMATLIARVRQFINDPAGAAQQFADQEIQDVLDFGRIDVVNHALIGKPTFSGSTIQYLDYFSDGIGDWEDSPVLKQYLTIAVTPATSENIVGHWTFAANVFPPVYLTGKTYDCFRASADLLERLAARWVMSYDFTSDGQSFRRSQVVPALQSLAKSYRMQQRAISINVMRSDLTGGSQDGLSLRGTALDYMASGDGR